MAIELTAVINNPNYKSWTVTALEADTTTTVAHGFGEAPDSVVFTPTNNTIAAAAGAGVEVTATNLVVTKSTAVGSGGAVPGTSVIGKIVAMRPHTIMQ